MPYLGLLMSSLSDRVWAAIAWALLIVGALVALVLKHRDDYVRYWAFESIGFTVVIVVAWVIVAIVSLLFAFTVVIPILLKILYMAGVLLAWVVGLFEALAGSYWRPPVIHDVSEFIRGVLEGR